MEKKIKKLHAPDGQWTPFAEWLVHELKLNGPLKLTLDMAAKEFAEHSGVLLTKTTIGRYLKRAIDFGLVEREERMYKPTYIYKAL